MQNPKKFMLNIFTLTCGVSSLFAAPIEHLRLVWHENPQTESTIVWDSRTETKTDRVELWERGSSDVVTFQATPSEKYIESKKHRDSKRNKAKEFQFKGELFFRHVKIKGLKPSTTYELKAYSDDDVSRTYHFVTAPEDERRFKLLYVGDSRTRVDVAEKISSQMADMAHEDASIIATIHGGDFANTPVLNDWFPWLAAWDRTTHQGTGKLMPIIPVVGNHEFFTMSPMFGQAYGFSGYKGVDYIYSCRLAPHFRIAVLNSEMETSGAQEEMAKDIFEQYKKEKVTFQLVAFHRPVYPAVKKAGRLKRLVPMFEKYNIDLVLESDGHNIKRTVPIREEKMHPEGVVYLGEGGYGAPQRQPKDLWYLKSPGFASKGDHMMTLDVYPDRIDYKTVGIDDEVIDEQAFKARQR
jgi:hypothetical protein